MSEYKSFQGKNVDDAIKAACRHFRRSREELEIEIMSGGSSGIFGLVGVKKATVRARIYEGVEPGTAPSRTKESPSDTAPEGQEPVTEKPVRNGRPAHKKTNDLADTPFPSPKSDRQGPGHGQPETGKPAQPGESRPVTAIAHTSETSVVPWEKEANTLKKFAPRRPVPPEMNPKEVKESILETTRILLTNISDQGGIHVDIDKIPIMVVVDDEDNSGLIIGRDGQTLAALQYLLNRIVSRKFPGVARIQLDAGDYREKQDEQLRRTAQLLAEKARTTSRMQSTRPLSSYHRRVVHVALQDDTDIVTRSKGDGPLKRVLIIPRRKKMSVQEQDREHAAAQPAAKA